MKRCLSIFFLVICSFSGVIVADDIFDLGTRHFRTVPLNGERSSVITSIAQSPDGLIWKGSQWGLFFYDGYNYLRPAGYKKAFSSFDRQYIKRIWFSDDGDLYAGTAAAGIVYWDKSQDRWLGFNVEAGNLPSECSGRVSAFAQANERYIWVGTDSGLCVFDSVGHVVSAVPLTSLEQRFVRALWSQGDFLWLGTQTEISRVPQDKLLTFLFGNSKEVVPELEHILEGVSVSSIRTDEQGYVWFSNENAPAYSVSPEGELRVLESSLASAELAIAGDEVWLATYSEGLQVFNRKTHQWIENFRHDSNVDSTLDNDELESILFDRSGILWVGTRGHGFNTIVPEQKAFRLLFPSPRVKNSLSVSNVHIVKVMRNGEVWFGSTSNGIDVFDQKKGLIRAYRHRPGESGQLQGPHILSMDQDQDDVIWVASQSSGVYRYNASTDSFRHYFDKDGVLGGRLRQVFSRSNGDILVAGERGVTVKRFGSEKFEPLLMSDEQGELQYSILNIYERINGDLWLNGMDRQYFIPRGQHQAQRLDLSLLDGSPLPQGSTLGIRDANNGRFYMYKGGKLLRLVKPVVDGKAVFELVLDKSIGKLDHFEDENGMWWTYGQSANTNNWAQRRFSEADGMPMSSGWIFSLDKTANNTYLYGSPYGVVMLKANLFKDWFYQAPTIITSYIIDGEKIDAVANKEFEFPARAKSLTFEFSVLDYSLPDENLYEYRLLGFDDSWTPVDYKNRRATYTNLSPGSYQFQVRGSNRLGVWSDAVASRQFDVMPKWFQSWWFIVLLIISAACLLVLIYQWRVRHLHRKQEELSGLVRFRTQELQASIEQLQATQKKLVVSEKMASLGRLVRGVAHEINTPLGIVKMAASSLQSQAEILHSSAGADIQQKTRKALNTGFQMLDKNIDRIGNLVSTFKELAPDEHLAECRWVNVSVLLKKFLLSKKGQLKGIKLILEGDEELMANVRASILQQVVLELVQNAQLHAWPETFTEPPILTVCWNTEAQNASNLCVSIEDNGYGISESERHKIFDPFYTLGNSAERSGLGLHAAYLQVSQQLSGELHCDAVDSGGSRFTLVIPLDPEASIGETTG